MTEVLQGLLYCLIGAMFFTCIAGACCRNSGRIRHEEDAQDAAHGIQPRWDEA